MRALLIALCAPFVLALPAAGQLATTTPSPRPVAPASRALTANEQLFTSLIGQVATAIEKRDMKAMSQLMTPDYIHYDPGNGMGGRAEELAYVGQWVGTKVKTLTPIKVTRRGDMAVTVGTSTFSGQMDGKPFSNTVNMMIAWVLKDGQWQMAVVHSKLVPA